MFSIRRVGHQAGYASDTECESSIQITWAGRSQEPGCLETRRYDILFCFLPLFFGGGGG